MATEQLLLTAIGDLDQWTLLAGSTKVTACQTPDDDDTSYIGSGTTANYVQLFQLADPGDIGSGDTINYVRIRIRHKRLATPAGDIQGALKTSGGTVYTDLVSTGPNWADQTTDFTEKPGGGSWTLATLAELQAGVRNGDPRDVACTTIEVIVDYTPAAPAIMQAALCTATASSYASTPGGGANLTGSLATVSTLSPVSGLTGAATLAAALPTAAGQAYPSALSGGAILGASLPQASALSYPSSLLVEATLAASLCQASALSYSGGFIGGAILHGTPSGATGLCYDANFITGVSGLLEAALAEALGLSPVADLVGGATLQAPISQGSALSYAGAPTGSAVLVASLSQVSALSQAGGVTGGAILVATVGGASALAHPPSFGVDAALLGQLTTAMGCSFAANLLAQVSFMAAALTEATALSPPATFEIEELAPEHPIVLGRRHGGIEFYR